MLESSLSEIDAKALDFLADVTKLVISLSSAILAFTVTFSPKMVVGDKDHRGRALLSRLWMLLGLSIAFGLATLLILTGQLGRREVDIYATNIRVTSALQFLGFGIAAAHLWLVGKTLLTPRRAKAT